MNLSSSLGAGAAAFSADAAMPPVLKIRKVKHDLASYGHLRTVLEFSKWAHEQSRFPTIDAVCTRFNVHRSTAYRWTNALAAAYGIDPPPRSGQGAR
ncbi:hypothetical protein [Stenotrophomonas sp. SMYL86]|uniref:hypothetical protein n=1 Tax=Stenotrophomonas sp. SMYL86 TaxID=3076044 RepID=UPI002E7A0373|nr:hypothetical protein [Stenotrophomonas sp. SMYL86]